MSQTEIITDTTSTPVNVPVTESEKPTFEEGQILSIQYLPQGPLYVVWENGKQVPKHEEALAEPILVNMSKKEVREFILFCQVQNKLLSQAERAVPLLVSEVEQILRKSSIKKLIRKGLVESQTLTMKNKDKDVRSHAFCWLTPNGKAYRNVIFAQQVNEIKSVDEAVPA